MPESPTLNTAALPIVTILSFLTLIACLGLSLLLAMLLDDVTRPDTTSHPMGLPIIWVLIWHLAMGTIIAGGAATLIASSGLTSVNPSRVTELVRTTLPVVGAIASGLPALIYGRNTLPRTMERIQETGWGNLDIHLISNLPVVLGGLIATALLTMAVIRLITQRKTPPE